MSPVLLKDARLLGTDLRGANLRDLRGIKPGQVRRDAQTDATTQF